MTRLQQSLRQRLEALHQQQALWSAFAQAWADECAGDLAADADALLNDCLQQETLDVLETVQGVASKLGKSAAGPGGVPEVLRQVAIGICLVACEKRIHDKFASENIGTSAIATDEMLIDASEQLAAAVIAAAWCENGVRIHFDGQTRSAEAVNVVRDVPPQELDFSGPRDCVKAELQAMVKAPLDELATGNRRTLLHDVRSHGVVSDDVLQSQLKRYAKKNDCRLMFGLNAAAAHPLDEAELRTEFAVVFDAVSYTHLTLPTSDLV